MRKRMPEKIFVAAPARGKACGECNECEDMKKVTLENIVECLETLSPEIEFDEPTRKAAERSILNMVAVR